MEGTEVLTGMAGILENVTLVVTNVISTFGDLMADTNIAAVFGLGIAGTILGLVGKAISIVR